MTSPDLLTAALAWHRAGYCVLPAAVDGTKRPAVPWRDYQTARPDEAQIAAWFTPGRHDGLGLVCGAVSGHLEMLELEGRAVDAGAITTVTDIAEASGLGPLWARVGAGYAERTPSGGVHLLYRVDGHATPNTKLASRPATDAELTENPRDKVKVLAETRGEGGWTVLAPSTGRTHPTGGSWTVVHGDASTVPTLTVDERDALHDLLRMLDEMPPVEVTEPAPAAPRAGGDGGVAPGADFTARATWASVLEPHGWRLVFARGDVGYWCRPGKTRGVSATTNALGTDRLRVFTTSTEFDAASYSKFGAYATLNHGGNYSTAAQSLRRDGYGTPASHTITSVDTSGSDLYDLAGDDQAGEAAGAKPSILLTNNAEAARTITAVINNIGLPDVYVTNGALTRLERVSGDLAAVDRASERAPALPAVAVTMTVDSLSSALAHHTFTHAIKTNEKTGEQKVTEMMPSARVLAAVLSERYWPGVRPLYGIVGTPVLRPDGTLMQDAGYDTKTGLYLAPKVTLPRIPEQPGRDQVDAARAFLLHDLLGDFPWVQDADRANYVALLVTQILRPYMRGALAPFGLISATTQSSGKSILSGCIGMLFGHEEHPWLRSDEELRKTITADLANNAATIIFDNVKEGAVIDSPVFAGLFTRPVWSDRLLGTNQGFTAPNDRLWLATGNNVHLGGDMRTRTVLVRLDPNMPRPETRTDFVIPNLDAWIKRDSSRATLLEHLLVLVMDWIAAGAPRGRHPMRQFSTWAEHVGGFTAHHGIEGFLANASAVAGLDDEDAEWIAFLERWRQLFGSEKKEAKHVRQSGDIDFAGGRNIDRWEGDFITDRNGAIPSTKSLGRYLAGQVGRYHGDYVLRSESGTRSDRRVYWVEEYHQ